MPGIHFIRGRRIAVDSRSFASSLQTLRHDDQYRSETLYYDDEAIVAGVGYEAYPISVWDDPDYFIVLEGKLYGLSREQTRAELREVCPLLFGNDEAAVRDWLLRQDGEFLLLVRDRETSRWAFVNDVLARLPVYHYRDDDREILSREIRFVAANMPGIALDRMAIAQYLLLEFPHGERTLLEDVRRLPPSTLLLQPERGRPLVRHRLHTFNLDEKNQEGSLSETADRLVTYFVRACRRQSGSGGTTVVSLSGGLDSRSVAAGLKLAGCRAHALSFSDALGRAAHELGIAEEIAKRLELDWNVISLPPPTGREVKRHLYIKGGMSYVAQAFGLPFLDEIVRRFGPDCTFMSGDGGGTTLPEMTPGERFNSVRRVVSHYLQRYQVLPFEVVTNLTGVGKDELIDELTSLIESYPEQSLGHKYVHLILYCRRIGWSFEGEDSNRAFFWTTTPFHDPSFFTAAMAVPDGMKHGHRLYREFLTRLSEEAAGVADANRNLVVTSPAYERRHKMIARLNRYPRLARTLRRYRRPRVSYPAEAPTVRCLRRQAAESKVVAAYFEPGALASLAESSRRYSREALDNVLTVTSAAELLTGEKCTVDQFLECEF